MVMESLVLDKPALGIGLAVGLRTYLEIVKVEAPSEASYGTTVSINIYVRNKWTYRIFTIVTGAYDTAGVTSTSHYVDPGKQRVFGLSFTMPNKSVNLWVWAFYWTEAGWSDEPDDEYGPISISLPLPPVGWQLLASKTLAVRTTLPPVVGWVLLATKTLAVRSIPPVLVGWQLLDTATLAVKPTPPVPVGWQLLDTTTIAITSTVAPPVGWHLLDSTTVSIGAAPLPEWWELVHHYIDPWAYFYDGEAETAVATYTLPPEEFPYTEDMAMKIKNGLIDKLEEEAPGSKLLEVKLYRDKAGPLWSRWRIEITASVPAVGYAVPYVIPWPLIIKGVLIIVVIALIYFIVKTVTTALFGHKALSPAVKAKWFKPELIPIIVKLRPAYSPEALEELSDQELRDILDEVYEEEVKPKGLPWWQWAIIGGLGIAGGALALRYFRVIWPKKPEKK